MPPDLELRLANLAAELAAARWGDDHEAAELARVVHGRFDIDLTAAQDATVAEVIRAALETGVDAMQLLLTIAAIWADQTHGDGEGQLLIDGVRLGLQQAAQHTPEGDTQ